MAITLDVITKIVDSSLRSTSSTVEKHFTKTGNEAGKDFAKSFSKQIGNSKDLQTAFDKAADAAGKLRIEQAKLNDLQKKGASNSQLITQSERLAKARRDEERAVRSASRAYDDANNSAQGMLGTLSELTAGTRFGGMITSLETLSSKFSGVGLVAAGAIGGVTALALGAGKVTKELYDLGRAWDDVVDGIAGRTGMIGDELEAVKQSVKDVALGSVDSIEVLGDLAGQVAQTMRLTGTELESMVFTLGNLNALTGDQTNIRELTRVFRKFGIEAGDQKAVLDDLYTTFTNTGIPVNELLGIMSKAGSSLKQFNMGFGESAGLIGALVESGADYEQVVRALMFATRMFASENRDAAEGLSDVITRIQDYYNRGEITLAQQTAMGYFGKRAWIEIYDAITTGGFSVEDFTENVAESRKSIDETRDATNDLSEEWVRFGNWFKVGFEPAATSAFDSINNMLESLTSNMLLNIADLKQSFQELGEGGWFGPGSAIGELLELLGLRNAEDGLLGGGGSFDTPTKGSQKFAPGKGRRVPYGLPAGTNSGGYGGDDSAFPQWVRDIADFFGIKPSTYPNHQTDNRNEPGYAPNPQGLNRGIDWTGPVENLQNFAEYLETIAPMMEQVIWQNPYTKRKTGIGGGKINPGYYPQSGPGGYDTHGGNDPANIHIHTRQSMSIPLPAPRSGMRKLTGRPRFTNPNMEPTTSAGMLNFAPETTDAGDTTTTDVGGSPFGSEYLPGPTGSTGFGYNEWGDPGFYVPSEREIDSATRRVESIKDAMVDLSERLQELREREQEIKDELAELATDPIITQKDREAREKNEERLNDQLEDVSKNIGRTRKQITDLQQDNVYAQEDLEEARKGSFRGARKAPSSSVSVGGSSAGMGQVGASLANDFGLSEGLPGVAQWLTSFLANLAFAPMLGGLSAVAAGSPVQGGYGLMGMMGAQNVAAGGSPLGLSMPATNLAASAIGPSPLGGGLGAPHSGTGAEPGPPATPMTSQAPGGANPSGGFKGVGGLPLAGMQMAAMGADMFMPGAGQAAQTGIEVINRTIGFAGQLAAIGVGGFMETLLPNNSDAADPSKSWLGKVVAGFAGARPAMPNTAGTPAQPQAAQQGDQQNGGGGPLVNIENMVNQTNDSGMTLANEVSRQAQVGYLNQMGKR